MAEPELPKEFRDAVADVLHHAQVIEWMLRVVLSDMNEAADLALSGKGIRFKMRVPHLENRHTLGSLVERYAMHSDNGDLVKRLRAFTGHRNKAAHVYFVAGWYHRHDAETLARGLAQVNEHVAEGKALVGLVTVESVRVYEVKRELEQARGRAGDA